MPDGVSEACSFTHEKSLLWLCGYVVGGLVAFQHLLEQGLILW
jgi:hypothetical protein